MDDFLAAKTWLTARLAEIKGQLAGIESELDQPHAQDWEDAATEREGDEVLESMGISGQVQMRRITAALARIEEGTYGTCAKCGDKIDADRLAALRETPLCRACAQAGQGRA